MSLFEYIIIGGITAALLISLIVLFRLAGMSRNMDGSDVDQRLIEIQTLLSHFSRQTDEREKTLRGEFKDNRDEVTKSITSLSDTMRKLGQDQANQQEQFRTKLDEKMKELRAENSQKLDEMRKTVDEKLQTTLERRLSESFKTVSERLEAVQRGLGEMQNLATGVGDLKRVLTNVKSRGTFGEVQLDILIQDVLTPNQYVENYDCGKPSGQQRVEYGIRMPGTDGDVYLPIDAKFPTEDYERLLAAVEVGDVDTITVTQKALMNKKTETKPTKEKKKSTQTKKKKVTKKSSKKDKKK